MLAIKQPRPEVCEDSGGSLPRPTNTMIRPSQSPGLHARTHGSDPKCKRKRPQKRPRRCLLSRGHSPQLRRSPLHFSLKTARPRLLPINPPACPESLPDYTALSSSHAHRRDEAPHAVSFRPGWIVGSMAAMKVVLKLDLHDDKKKQKALRVTRRRRKTATRRMATRRSRSQYTRRGTRRRRRRTTRTRTTASSADRVYIS